MILNTFYYLCIKTKQIIMKQVGNYSPVTDKFDLEHEINLHCDRIKEHIEDMEEYSHENEKAIKKAVIETILNSL